LIRHFSPRRAIRFTIAFVIGYSEFAISAADSIPLENSPFTG
jgi:hypothetical protein